jgi:hypothetical protein
MRLIAEFTWFIWKMPRITMPMNTTPKIAPNSTPGDFQWDGH